MSVRSTVVYDSKLKLPAPLDGISIVIGTSNGGATFTVKGIDGIDPKDLEIVLGRVRTYLNKVSSERQAAEAKTKAVVRQDKEAEAARLHAEKQERARQARIDAFRESDEHPISLAVAQKKFPGTPFKVRAPQGAGIARHGKLKFIAAVMEPRGGTSDKMYWFDPGDRSVDSICPRCAGDLHLAASGHGYAIVACNEGSCSFRERRERPVERVKSTMNPAAYSLVG